MLTVMVFKLSRPRNSLALRLCVHSKSNASLAVKVFSTNLVSRVVKYFGLNYFCSLKQVPHISNRSLTIFKKCIMLCQISIKVLDEAILAESLDYHRNTC